MKSEWRILTVRSRDYDTMLDRVVRLIDEARRASARSVNAIMSATYWSIGRHIVEFELKGKKRAEYGEELLERVSVDLTSRFRTRLFTASRCVSSVRRFEFNSFVRHCLTNCY